VVTVTHRHLLVTNDFPPKTGGIQVYLHELWRRMDPSTFVILTANSHPEAKRFDAAWAERGMVIERVDHRTLFVPTRSARAAIEAAVARHDCDLVLLDPAFPLGQLGRSLSVPYGVILHGAEVTIPGRLPVARQVLRSTLRQASLIISAGTYAEAEARRLTGAGTRPVVVVPPGVDTARFVPLDSARRAEVRARFELPMNAPVVVSVSRLVPRKGMDVLIDAAALLAPRWGDLVVAIGGSGRDAARLQRRIDRTGAPVRLLGRVADEDLPGLLASADVFAMACRNRFAGLLQEGFGIVFVEAAATGVAQVAGMSGGSHEAVHDQVTGLLCDRPDDPVQVAERLASLLTRGARACRGIL
jgi:phosphatidyl-myo-inositol dimannoside synthase